MSRALHLSRADITGGTLVDVADAPLVEGQVRLRLNNFALTSNNVTYAATGEELGYWHFFPTGDPATGRLPVWGIATVTESHCEVPVGERAYGYFPMAENLIALPGRLRETTWTDLTVHRTELPPVYNQYFRLAGIPGHESSLEDLMGLLYPLYATSFLLADFVADNAWFGAEQIVVGSASSKTAIGFMQMAARLPDCPRITGLTSSRNVTFVEGFGCAATVLTYEAVQELQMAPSIYVDMSGNTDVRRGVHERLAKHLTQSIAVGLSHWDKFEQGVDLPGVKPEFFFAPAQIKKRRGDWGAGAVEARIMEAWRAHARQSHEWLTLVHHDGLDAGLNVYRNLAAGNLSPRDGHVVHLDRI